MAWDIVNATYTSTKDVSAQDANPRSVAFSSDGTKMFMVGYNSDSVHRYDLSSAWDITSAVYVSTKGVGAQDSVPTGVVFSPDGTQMFVSGATNDSVFRYDLSTAWDITSASHVSTKDISAQEAVVRSVAFSPDGTKMFMVGDGDNVYRYDLSTAWDITSASHVSTKNVGAQDSVPFGVTFSGDGTQMFVSGATNDSVFRYDLSTAWDITSASHVSTKDISAQDTTPTGVTFSGDGAKMFVVGSTNDSVYRYDMSVASATVAGTPAGASSASDAEVTAGSVTVTSVLASAISSTLTAVVAATLVLTGTPADATSATDATAATATIQTSGTPAEATSATAADAATATIQTSGAPADATSATDAAPTSENFSTATPPGRTHTIPAESRLTTIAAENRITTIPAESRITTIGAP